MCTGISYKSIEGNQYLGRTQEYSIEYDYYIGQFPRNLNVDIYIQPWASKYSVLGVSTKWEGKVAPAVLDGINEFGLTVTTQFFSKYNVYSSVEEITKNNKFPLLPEQVSYYLLANCKDINEVITCLDTIGIADIPMSRGKHGLPLHFLCKEPSGRTVVIEPSKKLGFEVFENTVGVMTNSPSFDWHVVNLENYISLSDSKVDDLMINDLKLTSSISSGLRGIPGDYSASSRFVRATYLLHFSDEVSSEFSINRGFHILNTTDIIKGTIKLPGNDEGTERQYTHYTSMYDLNKKQLYVKLYDNFSIQTVAMKPEYYNATTVKSYELVKAPHYITLD